MEPTTTSMMGTATPLQLGLDIVTLFIGIYIMWQLSKAAIGGVVGTAFKLVLAGIFALTINHFLDTIFLTSLLQTESVAFLQEPIVHRSINLIGFFLMAWGFSLLPKAIR